MNKRSGMLRRALIVGGLCVVVATVASVAWAMTSASTKIVACAKKSNGALRLVDAAKDCRKTERAVIWNTQGPQGPRGPAGARGPAGEDGVDGEDGLDGQDGVDGDDGDDGIDGIDGQDGAQGPPGPATEPKWRYAFSNANVAPSTTTPVKSEACAAPVPQAVNGGYQLTGSSATLVRATGDSSGCPVPAATRRLNGWCSSRTPARTCSKSPSGCSARAELPDRETRGARQASRWPRFAHASAQPQPDERHRERDHRQ